MTNIEIIKILKSLRFQLIIAVLLETIFENKNLVTGNLTLDVFGGIIVGNIALYIIILLFNKLRNLK